MILMMFQRQYPYFPTLREIRDELIEGQIDHIRSESYSWNSDFKFKLLKSEYTNNWKMLFKLADLDEDLD